MITNLNIKCGRLRLIGSKFQRIYRTELQFGGKFSVNRFLRLIGLTYPGTKVTLLSGVDGNLSTSYFSIINLGQGNNYSHLASMCLINGIINKLMLNYRLQGIVVNYNLRRNAIDYHSN